MSNIDHQQPSPAIEPLLTAVDVASYYRVSAATLDRWIRGKRIAAPIVIGGERRWRREDVIVRPAKERAEIVNEGPTADEGIVRG